MNNKHNTTETANSGGPACRGDGPASLLEEAESLKSELREAYGRAVRLVNAIKRQRKQSRLVKSTLESLKQLPSIE